MFSLPNMTNIVGKGRMTDVVFIGKQQLSTKLLSNLQEENT
jgi:hypothetical protein